MLYINVCRILISIIRNKNRVVVTRVYCACSGQNSYMKWVGDKKPMCFGVSWVAYFDLCIPQHSHARALYTPNTLEVYMGENYDLILRVTPLACNVRS